MVILCYSVADSARVAALTTGLAGRASIREVREPELQSGDFFLPVTAPIVVVWSAHAAQSPEISRLAQFASERRMLVLVDLDGSPGAHWQGTVIDASRGTPSGQIADAVVRAFQPSEPRLDRIALSPTFDDTERRRDASAEERYLAEPTRQHAREDAERRRAAEEAARRRADAYSEHTNVSMAPPLAGTVLRRRAEGPGRTPEPRRAGEYQLWFGTNREPTYHDGRVVSFAATRDPDPTRLHLGICRVFVPQSHTIGSLGSSWWRRLLSGDDDRLKLTSVEVLPEAVFWLDLRSAMTVCEPSERDVVVFLHGYNVSFELAALRAAQIGFDLGFPGAMAFYSWPSRARLTGYAADAAAVEASTRHIVEFLRGLARHGGAERLHVIAHSMGNRGILRALERISLEASSVSPVRFQQIILAAPDVDRDTFTECLQAHRSLSVRTTAYVSSGDSALLASHRLHQFPRAGLTPPVCVVRGVDTVDVANVDLSLLGHGYVAEVRAVLQDMHGLLTSNAPPAQRFGLRPVVGAEGLHWTISA